MPIELTKDGIQPPKITRELEIFMEIIRFAVEDLREVGLLDNDTEHSPSSNSPEGEVSSVGFRKEESVKKP